MGEQHAERATSPRNAPDSFRIENSCGLFVSLDCFKVILYYRKKEGSMSETNEQFDACYNSIISNNYPAALESFKAAYREHPEQFRYLHGIVISYLFLGQTDDLLGFLDSEKNVTVHRTFVSRLLAFIRRNDFSASKVTDRLYNVAVFVSRRISVSDAKLYFSTGLLIAPQNPQFLTAVAEYALMEGNYGKGLSFYSQAASGRGNTPS
jgi:hypothetical protein